MRRLEVRAATGGLRHRGRADAREERTFGFSGADLIVWSDVPIGAGLSSSAALEVSVVHALLTQSDLPFDPIKIAQICQRAENDFVGMRCGVMDQYIACCGVAGHALLIDCRSLASRHVAIAPNLRLLIANSGVRHQHAAASTIYGARLARKG